MAVTIYFFVVRYLKFSKIKEIHNFAYHFLHHWFPNLTSYQKFNNRLNILYPIFYDIALDIIYDYPYNFLMFFERKNRKLSQFFLLH
jgi:hypothetical protein